MEGADVVVKSRYLADGSHGVPIEPRAVVAQWHGDSVTVWSSTQTPFAAKGGVAHSLGIPESNVRIIVPLLGGGFGSKCDFHYEAHVAALARAAGRPVKLVFSRKEEFIAPDHRRESILVELETGARRDGTLVARRGRLILDGGAYCGEGGFFAQIAAMHACGPYVLENVDVDAKLVYTNNQPSGSIRAPTAPQTCWAVEQHMDELAEALGLDPVELRRRTLIGEGDESPTRQVFGPLGMKESLERAAELIGYGQELPENEGIGVSCGWWPSFGVPSGAYLKLNADGTGTIVTGAQENGSGAVMGLPLLAAQVLGLRPEDFSVLYQDTEAGPWDMGSSGSQTTFNNGRAVKEAAGEVRDRLRELAAEQLEIDPVDLELADGMVRVKGIAQKAVSIAELAGAGGDPGQGFRQGARPARHQARQRVPRPARHGVLSGAAADHPRRPRQGRPGDGRRSRAASRRGPRLGDDHQPHRRPRTGARWRGDGHRPGAVGGHAARRGRPPAQPAPARLQARDLCRRAANRYRVRR